MLTWSEKATLIMRTVLERYLKDPSFLEHTGVVCKVPGHMILRIQGGA